ncbi:MAG: S1/P1 nuclease [Prevotellaceae bacterium]|jgi:hypothetical protein|nr:S1/P1 nuclease [Prevotellaceae bacterium]
MKKLHIRLAFVLTLLPLVASAWGPSGHRIIGEMSETLLGGKVKKKVTAIFGNSSVAMTSNWGDEVRSDSAYDYTATWHYTNIDGGLARAAFDTMALKQDNGQNVYRVVALTAHLKQHPNDTAMLKMLVHLTEDMHCPMHMGRAADRGGNTIHIKWFGRNTSLHSLWDDGLIDFQKLSYTEYATHLRRVYPLRKIKFDGQPATILNWAWETYQTTEALYASADEVGRHYVYNFHHRPVLERSLVRAAEHLAALLNYIYQ